MMAYKIISVVGARPNFMKVAALCEAIKNHNAGEGPETIDHILVHTGQAYDANMSDFFFNDLDLPKPNLFLGVGPGSHSTQTAKIMEGFERVLLLEKPDVVIVVGDVDSTLACALVTKKTLCSGEGPNGRDFIPKLAHVEAGLRSFDRTMPEEVNRIVTDSISDYLFTTEESANQNLREEGIAESKVYFVGNLMIDTLLRHCVKAKESSILNDLQLCEDIHIRPYAVVTLHRPANVDDSRTFSRIVESLIQLSRNMPIVFPAHPRTLKQIQESDLDDYFVDHFMNGPEPWDSRVRIRLVPPLGYLDFLQLMSHAKVVLTDSGSVQEETTILGVPCITLRETTERPVTLKHGTNVLVGADPEKIIAEFGRVWQEAPKLLSAPPYWDGQAARRIVQILSDDQVPSCVMKSPLHGNTQAISSSNASSQ
jgi:UDP-N-acetylglucosamine 2-epimerase (non-hydrolysing)